METFGAGRPGQQRRRGIAAPLALPAGFGALLAVGAIAAGTDGGLSAGWVLGLAAAIVLAGAAVAEPAVSPVLAVIGWLTVIGFSRPPYAQLHLAGTDAGLAGLIIGGCAVAGIVAGSVVRRIGSSVTLWVVDMHSAGLADDQLVVPAGHGAVQSGPTGATDGREEKPAGPALAGGAQQQAGAGRSPT